jgi:hypothetical protein
LGLAERVNAAIIKAYPASESESEREKAEKRMERRENDREQEIKVCRAVFQ